MAGLGSIPEHRKVEAQIIVIGAGGAGLAAAVAAAEKGAKVILLEKRNVPGGNTAMARGIFAAESPVQERMRIVAGRDKLFRIGMHYAHWTINPRILRAFVDKSGDTIGWLEEKGLKFEDVLHYYPNQVPRVFHVPEGRGAKVVKLLVEKCRELGVQLFHKAAAKKILRSEQGSVSGVLVNATGKEVEVGGTSVIISTGGYSGNKELLRKYYHDYTEDLCLHGVPNTGDGLLMATEIGASTEGLGILHLRGPRFPKSSYINVVIEEPTTIWVNTKGERFVNEALATHWPEAGNALNRQPGKICYSFFDENIKQRFVKRGLIKGSAHFPTGMKMTDLGEKLQSEAGNGEVVISHSWKKIAKWIGAEFNVLKNTLQEYNSFCTEGCDKWFGKNRRLLLPLRTPPYYAVKCYQSFHGTIGGIKVNHCMEVLNDRDVPIPGLFAAGIDTGGWESNTYCLRLSGSTFGFALNSGRIAGESAVRYLLRR